MKTKEQISYNMSKVRSSGSVIEQKLGKALWASGIRYRKHYKKLIGRPDFVVVRARLAIFCDSSFWHGRHWPEAVSAFKSNKEFWVKKIESNIMRDKQVNTALADLGWAVLRFWDEDIYDNLNECVEKVRDVIDERSINGAINKSKSNSN